MIQPLLAFFIRLATGVRCHPESVLPSQATIYFANHTSHLDFLSIWAALPQSLRKRTHPVAAKDYWDKNGLRRWLAKSVFHAHLIDRGAPVKGQHPLDPLSELLKNGESVIIFPEGTRSRDGTFGSFKPGLYHLAKRHPDLPLVPVYLENMNRILPAGEILPIPLLGRMEIRVCMQLLPDETKTDFLHRAEKSVQSQHDHSPS